MRCAYIGPWDHGAADDADPFRSAEIPDSPDPEMRLTETTGFFDNFPEMYPDREMVSAITCYKLGADRCATTTEWPPAGCETESC
jgi:hypothetical protein